MGLEFLLVFMGLVPFAATAAGVPEAEEDGSDMDEVTLDWSELEEQLPEEDRAETFFDDLDDMKDDPLDDVDDAYAGAGPFAARIADFDPAEDMLLIEYPGEVAPEIAQQDVTEVGLQITLSDGGEIALDGVADPLPDDAFGFVAAEA